ncbi:MAG: hypothetical protein ABI700_21965 [Chloroflexota bacterium]
MSVRTIDTTRDAERVYNYIVVFIGDNGYPLRPHDIRDDLGFSACQLARALVHLRWAHP